MKTAVRYQSRGGNTKAAAEIIAKKLGIQAMPVEEEVRGYYDLLFVGGGVYMGKMDNQLYEFLQGLEAEQVGRLVCFSTTGSQDSTLKQMKRLAEERGIAIYENTLLVKMLLRGHSALGRRGGKLSRKQTEQICGFVEEVIEGGK